MKSKGLNRLYTMLKNSYSHLSDEKLKYISSQAEMKNIQAGDALIKRMKKSKYVFAIIDGEVEIFKNF